RRRLSLGSDSDWIRPSKTVSPQSARGGPLGLDLSFYRIKRLFAASPTLLLARLACRLQHRRAGWLVGLSYRRFASRLVPHSIQSGRLSHCTWWDLPDGVDSADRTAPNLSHSRDSQRHAAARGMAARVAIAPQAAQSQSQRKTGDQREATG